MPRQWNFAIYVSHHCYDLKEFISPTWYEHGRKPAGSDEQLPITQGHTFTSTFPSFLMPSCASLPQELVNEVINDISNNADLKACSLVSRSLAHPARNQHFHHIRVFLEEARAWLSRPPESVQRMAPTSSSLNYRTTRPAHWSNRHHPAGTFRRASSPG